MSENAGPKQAANGSPALLPDGRRIEVRLAEKPRHLAVADFAKQFFERFDDKNIVVIGAGEMGEALRSIEVSLTSPNITEQDCKLKDDLLRR